MIGFRFFFVAGLVSISTIVLGFTAIARADTKTWTGAIDANWSSAGNWIGGVPLAGDRLVFGSTGANRTMMNDLGPNTIFFDITFQGDSYVIGGYAFGLTGGITNSGGKSGNRIEADIQVTGAQTFLTSGTILTLSGNVDLGANALTLSNGVTVNGVISGTGSVTLGIRSTLTGANTYTGATTVTGSSEIDGVQPGSVVNVTGSFLSFGGTGMLGALSVTGYTATLSAGGSNGSGVGQLSTGDLALGADAYLNAQLNGTTAGSGFDQLIVAGTVALGSARLLTSLGYFPSVGQSYVLIDNDGADAVSGTFNGLSEGAAITINGNVLSISYAGGSGGNDVVLTVVSVPKSWSGAVSGTWSTSGNWQGGVPVAGDLVVFPSGAANLTNTNNLPAGRVFKSLLFQGEGYVIGGNAFGLTNGITNGGKSGNRIDADIQVVGAQTFNASGSALTLNGNVDLGSHALTLSNAIKVTGVISGTGSVTLGHGSVLQGANTYTGVTTVTGSSEIDGVQPASAVNVTGSFLAFGGIGTLGALSVTGYTATVSAGGSNGSSVGQLSTGNLTMGADAYLNAQLNGTTAGSGYDQLTVVGTVALGSARLLTSLGYAAIAGQSFVLIDNDGFDAVSGTFNGLSEGGTITFNGNVLSISYVGGSGGNDVVLTVVSVPKSWSGAVSAAWSSAGNWQGGVPIAGDKLVFPNVAANLANTNDLPAGRVFESLLFQGQGYVIGGNAFGLTGGITNSGGKSSNRIDAPIQVMGTQTFNGAGTTLTLNGTVDLGSHALTLANVTVNGVMSGTGTVTLGSQSVLTGANTYTGATTVTGSSEIDGVQPGSVVNVTGSFLSFGGTGTLGALSVTGYTVTLSAGGSNGSGVGRLSTGALVLGADAFLNVRLSGATAGSGYDQLTVTGTVTLGSARLVPSLGFVPARGQVFVLIDNDGNDAVVGTFAGLAEGAGVSVGPYPFEISYRGKTGNDVVLTSLSGDPFNAAPVAADDAFSTYLDTPLAVNAPGVLSNDSDADAQTLTVISYDAHSAHGGTVTLTPGGGMTYVPPVGFAGTDDFSYVVTDGLDATDDATVVISVLPSVAFSDVGAGLTGVYLGSCAWGDYDNDGDLDLVVTGNAGGAVNLSSLYRNDGAGGLTDAGAGLIGLEKGFATWGDSDNDGDLDLLVTGDNGPTRFTKLYRNDAASFVDAGVGLPGLNNSSGAWGDYDRDGDLDILVSGLISGSTRISRVYRKDGPGTYVDAAAGLDGAYAGSATWADYDNDGDLDALVSGYTPPDQFTRLYRNNGSGAFTDLGVPLPGLLYAAAAWADYDLDGDFDFVLTGNSTIGDISRIYRNDGGGTFTDIAAGLTPVSAGAVAWGDYDNDGDPDLLLTGNANPAAVSHIYRNDGTAGFTRVLSGMPGVIWSAVAWGDYDGDGDLDILLTGDTRSGYIARIYRNNGPPPSHGVPTMPGGLSATVLGDEVTFQWDPSTASVADAQVVTTGISYNLRVGTTPGGMEVLSPMSNPDGSHQVPQPGNARQGTSLTLKMPVGATHCYWTVQALGSANVASTFAPERTVSLQTGAPEAPVTVFALEQIAPNPTHGDVEVTFAVPREASVELTVLDIAGREVARLAEGTRGPGRYRIEWNGGRGARSLAAGIYFVRYRGGDKSFVKRLIVMR